MRCFGTAARRGRHHRLRHTRRAAGRQLGTGTLGRRPADRRRLRGRRRRALPHLVRQPGRSSGASCCTAYRTSSPRTASSRCGRGRPSSSAAGTRCQLVGRAHGRRRRRRRRRRQHRPCATTCCAATRLSTLPGSTWCTTASTPPSGRRCTTPTGCARWASTPTGRVSCSSAGSPGRRDCPYLLRAAAALPPDVQLVLCAGAPDTPEIGAAGGGPRGTTCARGGAGWSGSSKMLPRPDVVALLTRRHRLRLPVGVRAARHREPRGDGLRDRCGGHRHRGHPRGGGRR